MCYLWFYFVYNYSVCWVPYTRHRKWIPKNKCKLCIGCFWSYGRSKFKNGTISSNFKWRIFFVFEPHLFWICGSRKFKLAQYVMTSLICFLNYYFVFQLWSYFLYKYSVCWVTSTCIMYIWTTVLYVLESDKEDNVNTSYKTWIDIFIQKLYVLSLITVESQCNSGLDTVSSLSFLDDNKNNDISQIQHSVYENGSQPSTCGLKNNLGKRKIKIYLKKRDDFFFYNKLIFKRQNMFIQRGFIIFNIYLQ